MWDINNSFRIRNPSVASMKVLINNMLLKQFVNR